MLSWSLLLINVCLATASFHPKFRRSANDSDVDSEGPIREGAFISPNGTIVIIEAGDVGLYETGQYDSTVTYEKDVKFFLYTRDNLDDGQQLYLNDETVVEQSNFNASKLTKFVIHGFENNLRSAMIQLNKDGLLENDDVNVIAVDWSTLACDILYTIVVSEVPGVGKYVGEFIEFLVNDFSVEPSQIHLIGHSLGAHVSGFAGKHVQTLGYNISRISGLDPALPGYSVKSPSKRLAKTDADYVDCIHTCGGYLGFKSAICQADFYPNGGSWPQPGCDIFDLGVCSHGKSYEYYAASINVTNVFDAETCEEIEDGSPEGCSDEGAKMGFPAVKSYQGEFYLKTSSKYPYAEALSSY